MERLIIEVTVGHLVDRVFYVSFFLINFIVFKYRNLSYFCYPLLKAEAKVFNSCVTEVCLWEKRV